MSNFTKDHLKDMIIEVQDTPDSPLGAALRIDFSILAQLFINPEEWQENTLRNEFVREPAWALDEIVGGIDRVFQAIEWEELNENEEVVILTVVINHMPLLPFKYENYVAVFTSVPYPPEVYWMQKLLISR